MRKTKSVPKQNLRIKYTDPEKYFSKAHLFFHAMLHDDIVMPSLLRKDMQNRFIVLIMHASLETGLGIKKTNRMSEYLSDDESRLFGQLMFLLEKTISYMERYIIRQQSYFKNKDIAVEVQKAKKGDTQTFLKLVSIDPRWLCENWTKPIIARHATNQNQDFFKGLGNALANEKSKIYDTTRAKREKLIRFLESDWTASMIGYGGKKSGFNHIPENINGYLGTLVEKGVIDPDIDDIHAKTLAKLMRRHYISPGALLKKFRTLPSGIKMGT